jgi:hypothetical protein
LVTIIIILGGSGFLIFKCGLQSIFLVNIFSARVDVFLILFFSLKAWLNLARKQLTFLAYIPGSGRKFLFFVTELNNSVDNYSNHPDLMNPPATLNKLFLA